MRVQYKIVYRDKEHFFGPQGPVYKERNKFIERLRMMKDSPERYTILRVEVKETWEPHDIERELQK